MLFRVKAKGRAVGSKPTFQKKRTQTPTSWIAMVLQKRPGYLQANRNIFAFSRSYSFEIGFVPSEIPFPCLVCHSSKSTLWWFPGFSFPLLWSPSSFPNGPRAPQDPQGPSIGVYFLLDLPESKAMFTTKGKYREMTLFSHHPSGFSKNKNKQKNER